MAASVSVSAGPRQMHLSYRLLYYDSVSELPRSGETEEATQLRIESHRARLKAVRRLRSFHVREGVVRGGEGRERQKQVDVQLAVDMLTHAFNKNMTHALLVAGDLDFKPLVDALVQVGTHVEVFYERRSASMDLCDAADVATAMTLRTFHSISTSSWRACHPLPHGYGNSSRPVGFRAVMTCEFEGVESELLQGPDRFTFFVPQRDERATLTFDFPDREGLMRFIDVEFGQRAWKPSA